MNPTWLGQAQPRIGSIKNNVLTIFNGLNHANKLV